MSSRADETGEILQFGNTVVVPVNRGEKTGIHSLSAGEKLWCAVNS